MRMANRTATIIGEYLQNLYCTTYHIHQLGQELLTLKVEGNEESPFTQLEASIIFSGSLRLTVSTGIYVKSMRARQLALEGCNAFNLTQEYMAVISDDDELQGVYLTDFSEQINTSDAEDLVCELLEGTAFEALKEAVENETIYDYEEDDE